MSVDGSAKGVLRRGLASSEVSAEETGAHDLASVVVVVGQVFEDGLDALEREERAPVNVVQRRAVDVVQGRLDSEGALFARCLVGDARSELGSDESEQLSEQTENVWLTLWSSALMICGRCALPPPPFAIAAVTRLTGAGTRQLSSTRPRASQAPYARCSGRKKRVHEAASFTTVRKSFDVAEPGFRFESAHTLSAAQWRQRWSAPK